MEGNEEISLPGWPDQRGALGVVPSSPVLGVGVVLLQCTHCLVGYVTGATEMWLRAGAMGARGLGRIGQLSSFCLFLCVV